MKLLSKLTLFVTISKLAIVVLFVLTLPAIVERIASEYTNYYLRQQEQKVLKAIRENGIQYYLQGESSYGSYTMLKEEYIGLEPADSLLKQDTIETAQRVVEQDTLNYRVLMKTFTSGEENYLLEIGKTTATISQYNRPLQRIASIVLISLILITLVIDLIFTRWLLRPLGWIIETKLINRSFPFNKELPAIETSTTDFKYLDESLILLMDQINEAFEKEREFTANASHELMTPISILQHKIENLLGQEDLPETAQQQLIELNRTMNRLKKIVNSLLLISRIENEQFSKHEKLNVKQIIDELIEEIEHRMEERKISLKLQLPDDLYLNAVNRDLIFQLFYNLVNNAIKYNRDGGTIFITGELNANEVVIAIKDTGYGIAASELESIFNRFHKIKSAASEGYGLGLSIVKSIASYHKASIEVHSGAGGSTFTLRFPKN